MGQNIRTRVLWFILGAAVSAAVAAGWFENQLADPPVERVLVVRERLREIGFTPLDPTPPGDLETPADLPDDSKIIMVAEGSTPAPGSGTAPAPPRHRPQPTAPNEQPPMDLTRPIPNAGAVPCQGFLAMTPADLWGGCRAEVVEDIGGGRHVRLWWKGNGRQAPEQGGDWVATETPWTLTTATLAMEDREETRPPRLFLLEVEALVTSPTAALELAAAVRSLRWELAAWTRTVDPDPMEALINGEPFLVTLEDGLAWGGRATWMASRRWGIVAGYETRPGLSAQYTAGVRWRAGGIR